MVHLSFLNAIFITLILESTQGPPLTQAYESPKMGNGMKLSRSVREGRDGGCPPPSFSRFSVIFLEGPIQHCFAKIQYMKKNIQRSFKMNLLNLNRSFDFQIRPPSTFHLDIHFKRPLNIIISFTRSCQNRVELGLLLLN